MSITVGQWFLSAPPGVRTWMQTPDFLRFAREQQAKSFQMIGMYDGAMSEQCKQVFREQHDAIGALRVVIAVQSPPTNEAEEKLRDSTTQ